MKPRIVAFQLPIFAIVCCLLLLIAACGNNANSSGGDSTDSSAGNSDQPVVATMPPAQFTAVANQSVTKTMGVTTTEVVTAPAPAQASDADLQRGLTIYTKNKCSGCHGEKGEGVAGKATKTIAGTTLNKEEFDKFLRTGGGQGNDHIFGPSAISPGGMEALRAYVKSLAAQ